MDRGCAKQALYRRYSFEVKPGWGGEMCMVQVNQVRYVQIKIYRTTFLQSASIECL